MVLASLEVVVVALCGVIAQVLHELVLVFVVVEEVVAVPVGVVEVCRALPVARGPQTLSHSRPVLDHESQVVHAGMYVGLVRPLLSRPSVLYAQVGFIGADMDPVLRLDPVTTAANAQLRHGCQEEANRLIDIGRSHVQVLKVGFHSDRFGL